MNELKQLTDATMEGAFLISLLGYGYVLSWWINCLTLNHLSNDQMASTKQEKSCVWSLLKLVLLGIKETYEEITRSLRQLSV